LTDNNILILSQYTIDEIEDVFNEKFPHKVTEMKEFMGNIPYGLFVMKNIENKKYPNIRDIDDLPVLANAIESRVDLLITGDKDFEGVLVEKPRIMSPREYISEYIK
jgi:predicted nucleic acid-binding protein